MREYLTPDAVQATYGFTRDHLAQLRFTGRGPRYFKPTPKKVLYRHEDIEAWIEASVRVTTAEAS
jgi:hypothetical protein